MLFATENIPVRRVPFANKTNVCACPDGKLTNVRSKIKTFPARMENETKLFITKSGRSAHMFIHNTKTVTEQHVPLPISVSDKTVKKCDALVSQNVNDSQIVKRTCENTAQYQIDNEGPVDVSKMKLVVSKEPDRRIVTDMASNGFKDDPVPKSSSVPLNHKVSEDFQHVSVVVERLKQKTMLKYMKVPLTIVPRMKLPLTEENNSREVINSCAISNCSKDELNLKSAIKFNRSVASLNDKIEEVVSKNIAGINENTTQQTELNYVKVPLVHISVSNDAENNWLSKFEKFKSFNPKVIIENKKIVDDLSSDSTDNNISPMLRHSSNLRKLRKRKTNNYAEITLVQSPSPSPKKDKRHVPVYRLMNDDKSKEKPNDLYDFDSDSEKPKLKKRKKGLSTTNNKSIGFEKDMKKIMQRIEKKFKSKSRKVGTTAINKRVISNKKPEEFTKVSTLTCTKHKGEVSKQTINTNVGFSNRAKNVEEIISNQNLSKRLTNVLTNKLMDEEIEIQVDHSTNKTLETPPILHDDSDDHDDNMFGFDDYVSDSEVPINDKGNRINIISNVVIRTPNSQDGDKVAGKLNVNYQNFNRPNANSTMIMKSTPASPWRPNLGMPRNPHFLHIKDTLLPNYNQEMVIDWCLLEKTLPIIHTPDKSERPHKTHQTTMLEFISKSGTKTYENERSVSLFDCEDFSPIKSKAHDNSLLEVQILSNTFSPGKKSPNKIPASAKRNILGPRIDNLSNIPVNNENVITPLKKIPNALEGSSSVNSGIENYFGFDSFCDENEPSKSTKKNYKKTKQPHKPIRFVCFAKNVEETNVSDHQDNAQDLTNMSEIPAENNELEVGLFEDLESVPKIDPPRRYERRHVRARKQPVLSEDSDVEDKDKPRRKKKNARTKKEELEAEKWAAAFNSMCEEVEEYSLEIE